MIGMVPSTTPEIGRIPQKSGWSRCPILHLLCRYLISYSKGALASTIILINRHHFDRVDKPEHVGTHVQDRYEATTTEETRLLTWDGPSLPPK